MNWRKSLSGKIRFNEPLSKYTTFRIGGRAQLFIQPQDITDLRQLVINAKKDNLRLFIIGAGSNLLINDKGVNGIVIKLSATAFKNINYAQGLLEAGAGLSLAKLIEYALNYNLGGAEFLIGIPGTVGGALIMNAGITERTKNQELRTKNISDLVKNVTVMDYNGNIKVLRKNEIRFDYRASSLYNYIVLNAHLKIFKSNKRKIINKLNKYLVFRKKQQDYAYPSAGCIFKNPERGSAGKLIDLCGLKGKHFGDAYISESHANFIINKGKAKAKDVFRLMDYVKKSVKNKFGINLEPEIKIWQN